MVDGCTLPETKSKFAPKNAWLEDEFPFGMAYFQGQTSSFREGIYLGCCPLPVTVTTRIVTFLVGDSYKAENATVTGRGPHTQYI